MTEPTLSMTDVRAEIATGVTSAIDAIDWNARLGLTTDPVAPMAQELTTLPPAFSRLGSWIAERGDKPLADGEMIRISADQVEVIPPGEVAQMAQGGLAGVVTQLDSATSYDIPFGGVLFGAVPGAIAGEVIDGLIPLRRSDDTLNYANPLTKGLVVAGAAVFGDRFIGRQATQFFAGALVLQMFVDIVPIDRLVNWAVRQFQRIDIDDTGSAAQTITGRVAQGDVPIRQAGGGNRVLQELLAA